MILSIDDIAVLKCIKIYNSGLKGSRRFSGVSIDSRKCKKNDLFFAIKGERFDGHDFVKALLRKGIDCAVVNADWFNKNKNDLNRSFKKKCFFVAENTETAIAEIASLYRSKFVIPVIAVAGSNGKTSTKDFIAEVLSKKYKVLKTEGNLNNHLGVPLTVFRLKEEHEIAVIETGTNHFGEVDKLCRIAKPQFGLITNIGKEHLEFLKDIKGAAKAEGELAEYLREVYGTLFLNADDRYLKKYFKYNNIKLFSFGFNENSEVKGKVKGFNTFYPEIEIKYGKKKITAQLNNIGYQSCQAALCAAAVGFYFGLPVRGITKALSGYRIESNKRNQLKNINGIRIIDDTYNSNPDSVKAALENLKAYSVSGKKYIVLSDMLELGKASNKEHSLTGKLVKQMKFENLLTIGKYSFNTYLTAKGIKNNFYFTDQDTLAAFLKLQLKKGDLVLVKGSRSTKMENIIDKISEN